MKISFTPKVAYRMIERAKKNFLKRKKVSNLHKIILRSLEVFIIINSKLKTTAGTASFVPYQDALKLFGITSKTLYTVDNERGYFIIELNPKLIILDPVHEVFDTVSHELAHCLDFYFRGFYNRSNDEVHDKIWAKIHKNMGGSGNQYTQSRYNFELNRVKEPAKSLKDYYDNYKNTPKEH